MNKSKANGEAEPKREEQPEIPPNTIVMMGPDVVPRGKNQEPRLRWTCLLADGTRISIKAADMIAFTLMRMSQDSVVLAREVPASESGLIVP